MNLMSMVPLSWRKSPELAEIQRVVALELKRARDARDFVLAQLRVETATVGLVGWERAVGITTDLSLSLDLRRSKVKAKLQGLGVTTPEVIQTIVERFTGGDASLEEHPSEYWFKVVVDGVLNPPEDMDAMRHSVTEVKPAHLDHEYELQYQSGRLSAGCGMAVQEVRHYHYKINLGGSA